jgi:hypothetical protein
MKTFISLAFLLFTAGSYAQELSHKNQIIDAIGQNRFERLEGSQSKSLLFMNERIEMGYSIMELAGEKTAGFDTINEVQVSNPDKTTSTVSVTDFIQMYEASSLNILRVQLAYSQSSYTYYRLGNTGKVLILHSIESITKSLNNK